MTSKISDYQTPPPVCDYMTSLVPSLARKILEPFPGAGRLVRSLQARFGDLAVASPDNYFNLDPNDRWDVIVTNPPFSLKNVFGAPPEWDKFEGLRAGYQILKELMSRTDHLVLLLPFYTVVDSDKRNRALFNFGIRSMTILPRNVFGYCRVQTIVLQLERGYTGPSELKLYELLPGAQVDSLSMRCEPETAPINQLNLFDHLTNSVQ